MSKAARLRDAVLVLYKEHKAAGMLPTSGRFLFYELVARGIIEKKATGARRADQDSSEALMWLREQGLIPWGDIVDETRSLEDYTGYRSVKDGALAYLNAVQIDPWRGSWPMILTESRSLAGVLRNVARSYRVQIASTNGQCGGFLRTDISPLLRPTQIVLYLGDLDFSGSHIEANTRRVLGKNLRWERLALTKEQAKEQGLTPIPKFDRRDKKFHDAIETEALSQSVIVGILQDRLEELIPESIKDVQEREGKQRRRLRNLILA